MATAEEEEQRSHSHEDQANATNADSSSDSSDSDGDEPSAPVEWLATARAKRSTAGNRMQSMIAAEEPDDELELLFAEDDDDAGFTDVEGGASDVHMDSSSDDEDAQENADDLAGEKELERQARESRQAARKRKAQEAIPVKFRKKVKIDTPRTGSSTPTAPTPRPKKKSERTSWLPSPADMPTRASKRETTMLGKEQLHKQMVEREVKRLKQIEAMERKAKKMEALKKPPMTQAERLAEAAQVEKKNAKSLNRWEEAEKQREEERKAKLAALNNRTLEGPVVTFWSGAGEWVDGKLRHLGKVVTIEDKPMKKKRLSAAGHDGLIEDSAKRKTSQSEPAHTSPKGKSDERPAPTSLGGPPAKSHEAGQGEDSTTTDRRRLSEVENSGRVGETAKEPPKPSDDIIGNIPEEQSRDLVTKNPSETSTNSPNASNSDLQKPKLSETSRPLTTAPETAGDSVPSATPSAAAVSILTAETQPLADAEPVVTKPADLKPPEMKPPSTSPYTTSMFAPPHQSLLMKPPEMKPSSNSFLAPPAGISQGGLSMPVIGYHSGPSSGNASHVLAPPNTAQRQSPLSMPRPDTRTPPPTPPQPSQPAPTPTPAQTSTPAPAPISAQRQSAKTPSSARKPVKANAQKNQVKETAPPLPPSPPANGKATRNCIILQNFNENAVKEKAVQNHILFGQAMSKLPKQGPAPRCVITNHPAKYRDPKTGLPYYDSYAFRELRKLQRGEYRWSRLVGAWLGSGTQAATGVPARFTNPEAPGPPVETDGPEDPALKTAEDGGAVGADARTQAAPDAPVETSTQSGLAAQAVPDTTSAGAGGSASSGAVAVPGGQGSYTAGKFEAPITSLEQAASVDHSQGILAREPGQAASIHTAEA
ncbi:YL1 nuclear protein-domain-containing protein [Xylariaceae sp. FL0804]|nr:YL1 nuclear protein-domain-containing protein [Xylariaceae sp. FL0804]